MSRPKAIKPPASVFSSVAPPAIASVWTPRTRGTGDPRAAKSAEIPIPGGAAKPE